MRIPEVEYAVSGEASIAFMRWGDGDHCLTWFPGLFGHLEVVWEDPDVRRTLERLGRFAHVLMFDKRGTGLSSRMGRASSLEERLDDVRAVMDAAGVERAVVGGTSEGGPLAIAFAASYPERVEGLSIANAFAGRPRTMSESEYAARAEPGRLRMRALYDDWGRDGRTLAELFAPSRADDSVFCEWLKRMSRHSCSPKELLENLQVASDTDVVDLLPTVHVPSQVICCRGDRVVPSSQSRLIAAGIPGAQFLEFDSDDHLYTQDRNVADDIIDVLEEFVTGTRTRPPQQRKLATVMFVDVVGSTPRATQLGDERWRMLLDAHDEAIAREVGRHDGAVVGSTGDGAVATFEHPGRAVRCAAAVSDRLTKLGLQLRTGFMPARWSCGATTSPASRCTSRRG